MRNDILKKSSVVGIIMLFVGASVVPFVGSRTNNLTANIGNLDVSDWPYDNNTFLNLPRNNIQNELFGDVIRVDNEGDGDYKSIQMAIHFANPGDTIEVYSGTYEGNILIYKNDITIKGFNFELASGYDSGEPIIDGGRNKYVIKIISSGVEISGFIIQNSGQVGKWDKVDAGIWICNADCNKITNNIFTQNLDGIFVDNANNNIIRGNLFNDNDWNGVDLFKCSNNIVQNNSFNNDGLMAFDTFGNEVKNNTANNKPVLYLENASNQIIREKAGQIVLINCDNVTLENQNISNLNVGIVIYNSHNCLITKSRIESIKWYGILLGYSNQNTLSNNSFISNKIGLYFHCQSTENVISQNDFSGSPLEGILIKESNNNNIFSNNNFWNSRFHAWDESDNYWDNGKIGNYWDDYYGWDFDGDGIGDIPYPIPPYGRPFNFDRYPKMGDDPVNSPDDTPPTVRISKPESGYLYLLNKRIFALKSGLTYIVGPILGIDIEVDALDQLSGMHYVEIYIDGEIYEVVYYNNPSDVSCSCRWDETYRSDYVTIHAIAYDRAKNSACSEYIDTFIWNIQLSGPP